jgi:hypothetical protein
MVCVCGYLNKIDVRSLCDFSEIWKRLIISVYAFVCVYLYIESSAWLCTAVTGLLCCLISRRLQSDYTFIHSQTSNSVTVCDNENLKSVSAISHL